LPIFEAKCLRCHGADSQKAGLDARTRAGLIRGGETGPSLSPGSAERSDMWVKIAGDKMPPGKVKLTEAEKVTIRAWIDGGAKAIDAGSASSVAERQVSAEDRKHWAFRPAQRPLMPPVRNLAKARNPIDRFLLAALEAKGLSYATEAERATLVRRLSLDLTGLPPTPVEIDAFVNDPRPDAYEHLVERLLASPHYGERWGRHWLDLAGYADSEGILDADLQRSDAWRYRDYVIRAINADMPYDRFLQEQIAGDELVDFWGARKNQAELPAAVIDAVTATGFLRCASDASRPDFVNIKNAPGYYYQTLDDTLRILTSATMGLTLHCARCHSHKYDPIPQSDYYRLQAVFMSGYRPKQWVPQEQRRLLIATETQEKAAAAHNAVIDGRLAELAKQQAQLQTQFGDRLFGERLAKLPEVIREDVRKAFATEAKARNEIQKYLVERFQSELKPEVKQLVPLLTATYADYKAKSGALAESIRQETARKQNLPAMRAFYDLPGEVNTPLLRRGDYLNPGPDLPPGVLAVLLTPKPFAWQPPAKEAPTSGRRLAFARWLTQPDHPLTTRVVVNRLWLHHFGEGLVSTPDNFGRTGAAPSHPELLDWLATELPHQGWSLKAMHRLMVTSTAYRQTTESHRYEIARWRLPESSLGAALLAWRALVGQDPAAVVDPGNRLLWRQRLRRLEAESLRDSVLAVAGNLQSQPFGPPVPVIRQADGEVTTAADATGARRSIYLQVRRSQPITLLQVFDQPRMETNCTRRSVSTVASQALTLLNSDFLIHEAGLFAERVEREGGADQAGLALRLAFGRGATPSERAHLTSFVDAQTARHRTAGTSTDARHRALTDLCHLLLCANEFVYVE
jgi:hypothetical protein